ncbi:MAG: hypothetical protein E6G95_05300 [Alphaproteobacteria bacterium]|nr:MAG: hypothetical protein E6G95_05300 [Alphaproteobacteria bacterium]
MVERIYVVQPDDLKLPVRLYTAYQQSKGWRSPTVAETLEEALQHLQVTRAGFRPVSLPVTAREEPA